MNKLKNDTLLIGLGARFYRHNGRIYIENQTISGLKAWQDNFQRVIAFSIAKDCEPPKGWSDAQAEGLEMPLFEFVSLPDTYLISTLKRSRREAEAALLACMHRAAYRVFSYGGWIGDPGEIAAALARKHELSHAVWLDRVESSRVWQESSFKTTAKAKAFIKSRIISRQENRAVRTANLALLHGATVYHHFQGIARNPQVSEDIHLLTEDRISFQALSQKLKNVSEGPLRILYCGRAELMKGPHEWVQALRLLKTSGVEFCATWIGGGSQLEEIESWSRQNGLAEEDVSFPGFLESRSAVINKYRDAHILMFCHKTDESPRNLIESLHAATPIVGFRDPYAEKLVNEKGGGVLVHRGDVNELVKTVKDLAVDRKNLASLIEKAGQSASQLTREKIFKQRSDIVRKYLGDFCHD